MGAMAEDGTNKFLALLNVTTGLPVVLMSSNGGVSYATVYEPGAGDANNVIATSGKILFHGNFGDNVNIINYAGGALIDVSITGLGVGATINTAVYNAVDDTYYAGLDITKNLYKRSSGGVWSLINAALNQNSAKYLGQFTGTDTLYLAGVQGVAADFSTSVNGGITLSNKTGVMTGASAIGLGLVTNVIT